MNKKIKKKVIFLCNNTDQYLQKKRKIIKIEIKRK